MDATTLKTLEERNSQLSKSLFAIKELDSEIEEVRGIRQRLAIVLVPGACSSVRLNIPESDHENICHLVTSQLIRRRNEHVIHAELAIADMRKTISTIDVNRI